MKTITTSDPEFEDILNELRMQGDAVRRRREMSAASFREWLYSALKDVATSLGFSIQNLTEFFHDMSDAARTGFAEGREIARQNSIRARRARGGGR